MPAKPAPTHSAVAGALAAAAHANAAANAAVSAAAAAGITLPTAPLQPIEWNPTHTRVFGSHDFDILPDLAELIGMYVGDWIY